MNSGRVWPPRRKTPQNPFRWGFLRRPLFPGSSESDQFLALQKEVKALSQSLDVFFGDEEIYLSTKNLEQHLFNIGWLVIQGAKNNVCTKNTFGACEIYFSILVTEKYCANSNRTTKIVKKMDQMNPMKVDIFLP